MEQDWASLPKHLLDLTLGKLGSFTDYIQFGAVCIRWHSILIDNPNKQNELMRHHQVPVLLFPGKEEDTWSIYNITNNKFLELKLSLSYKRRFSGSSEGWLVIGNKDHTVTLHKPDFIDYKVENSQLANYESIDLPCLFDPPDEEDDLDPEILEYFGEEAYDYRIAKALITADPLINPDNCTIFMIFGGYNEIAFRRYKKDTEWVRIADRHYDDIIHYKNNFYAVDYSGRLVSFNIDDPSTIKLVTPKILNLTSVAHVKRYLVESCTGELLQVERFVRMDEDLKRWTTIFKVYGLNMDFDHEGIRWIETKSLGGAALFVGDNSSISVLASGGFQWNCQPNCIYFTHDDVSINASKGSDMGIYNVETGSFELHFAMDPTTFSRIFDRPPIWVVPIPNKY
ncbi:F-box protein SKIP23-like [Morus notabilis]|uniref:F-box protein SKIP23-like n=1 Tax=Morus notabilis TaxID=981085 RepID=UPI000CED6839|nr:F-box protein SKIP23-like [Morus notabilis]